MTSEERNTTANKATYHLPGLFEFYELYRRFLPLFREKREWFYPWCEVGSLSGLSPLTNTLMVLVAIYAKT